MSYTDCQKWLMDHGLRYPKTCKMCGLSKPCRYPGKVVPTTPESLHLAICQAVALLNQCPDADACRANTILRTALAEYVEPPKAPEARAGDCDAVGYSYLHKPTNTVSANMGEPGLFFSDNPSCEFVAWLYDRLTTKATPCTPD